jgi:prevent-host-death family protein
MYHIPVSDFKNEIAETLNRVAYSGERVLLQRHGKDVAALVSMKELHILEDLERIEDEQDEKEAAIVLNSIKSGKSKAIPWEDAKKELGI